MQARVLLVAGLLSLLLAAGCGSAHESGYDYANSRGADKVMYAGYYPMGLSLERIFRELPNVPLKDEAWPKFLRENAMQVFKLDE